MKLLAIAFGLSFSVVCYSQETKTSISAAEFCENIAKFGAKTSHNSHGSLGVRRGYSLRNLGIALGLGGGVRLGPFAKGATPHLKAQGFENLLEKQPNLLSEPSNIPDGAIFVLDKADSPDCPVNAMAGHVAVKCGQDSLMWQPGVKGLSGFITENPKCIKSVMYNPKWTKANKQTGEAAYSSPAAK